MENHLTNRELSLSQEPIVAVPASEALHDPDEAARIWPQQAETDPRFLEQIAAHRANARVVRETIDQLTDPTVTLRKAVETGVVAEDQAERFYDTLSDLLEDDDYERLVLYLPLEYIPDATWSVKDRGLQAAIGRFEDSYLRAWHDLLNVEDVRANFVDGDVLEKEHRGIDSLRVVKAAHLLPRLIRCGLVSDTDVSEWFDTIDGPVLRSSLKESFAAHHREDDVGYEIGPVAVTTSAMTPARQRWLEAERHEAAVAAGAKRIAHTLLEGSPLHGRLYDKLAARENADERHIFVEGVYKALEAAAETGSATAIYDKYEAALGKLWEYEDPGLHDRLSSVYRRMNRLGLADAASLEERGVDLPNLEAPWSENLSLMPDVVEGVKRVAAGIEAHAALSSLIYPVVLVGGSRLKGYGKQDSDVDIEIFVKPGVPESERQRIRDLMSSVLGTGQRYELTEFWLDEAENDYLRVRDFDTYERHTGDSLSNHLLFGAAWVGDEQAVADLQARLLPSYFYDSTDRQLHLEKMEQDALQYRLMHKGYARHYPLTRRADWTHNLAIDGHSVFWDPGYRRLATKLFVDTVFLPKLEN